MTSPRPWMGRWSKTSQPSSCRCRCEERAENAGHEEEADLLLSQPQRLAEGGRKAAAELDRRSFASGRPAEQVRRHRSDEHQRCHAQGHATTWLVDLLHDQVVATFYGSAETMVKQTNCGAAHWQQEQQPRMRETSSRGGIKAPEESGT